MGVLRHCRQHHHRRLPIITGFAFLLLASTSALSLFQLDNHDHRSSRRLQASTDFLAGSSEEREEEQRVKKRTSSSELEGSLEMSRRRKLSGPGSAPPTCRSKCGRCAPCRPVHVPVQPGLSIPLEYYPEAWRCKCRNKLFMP